MALRERPRRWWMSLKPDTWIQRDSAVNSNRRNDLQASTDTFVGYGPCVSVIRRPFEQGDLPMGSNRVAFSAIALACVVAAGTGGSDEILVQVARVDNRFAAYDDVIVARHACTHAAMVAKRKGPV